MSHSLGTLGRADARSQKNIGEPTEFRGQQKTAEFREGTITVLANRSSVAFKAADEAIRASGRCDRALEDAAPLFAEHGFMGMTSVPKSPSGQDLAPPREKDNWDKIVAATQTFSSILTPIITGVLALWATLGGGFTTAKTNLQLKQQDVILQLQLKQEEAHVKLLDTALSVLRSKPDGKEGDATIRKWAIAVVSEFGLSPKLDAATKDALLKHEIPSPPPIPSAPNK